MPIATIIAAETADSGLISEACDILRTTQCEPAEINWLQPGKAVDIGFTGDIQSARVALRSMEVIADIVVQQAENRRKMLLISDMDSTMITVECIDELADYAGIKPQIAEITERAMLGELDFVEALKARVQLLAGLDEAIIQRCLSERVEIMPGAETLVKTMTSWGAGTILISGGFTHFSEPVAKQIGFAKSFANQLDIAGGILTGNICGQIVDAAAKQARLAAAAIENGLIQQQTLAVGDGANDIPMIEYAGLGVSYHAKPKAEAAADFAIRHNDLTAMLYAQGVRKSDWK
jgi:phosphoserine phosphatase